MRGDIAMAAEGLHHGRECSTSRQPPSSPHPADYWTVLADFYRGRQRWSDLDAAIQNCVSAAAKDKNSGVALYDGAGVLIAAKRNPHWPRRCWRIILRARRKVEEAPAFIATFAVRASNSNSAMLPAHKQELAAAAAMAHEYNPAQALNHRARLIPQS